MRSSRCVATNSSHSTPAAKPWQPPWWNPDPPMSKAFHDLRQSPACRAIFDTSHRGFLSLPPLPNPKSQICTLCGSCALSWLLHCPSAISHLPYAIVHRLSAIGYCDLRLFRPHESHRSYEPNSSDPKKCRSARPLGHRAPKSDSSAPSAWSVAPAPQPSGPPILPNSPIPPIHPIRLSAIAYSARPVQAANPPLALCQRNRTSPHPP